MNAHEGCQEEDELCTDPGVCTSTEQMEGLDTGM
jgi:hypothetical protein